MKITNEQSKEIYEQSKSTTVISTNTDIAKKYGIRGAVRKHIKKWESSFHEIAKNDQKVNAAVTQNTLDVIAESLMQISNIKSSIQQARNQGVSPDKLPGLFNNWIRALELHSELLGAIRSGPDVNAIRTIILKDKPVGISKQDETKFKLKYKIDDNYDLTIIISTRNLNPISFNLITGFIESSKTRLREDK